MWRECSCGRRYQTIAGQDDGKCLSCQISMRLRLGGIVKADPGLRRWRQHNQWVFGTERRTA